MKLTPEASMRMSASPGPGLGVGRSRTVSASGPPGLRIWMACMSGWMLRESVRRECNTRHPCGTTRTAALLLDYVRIGTTKSSQSLIGDDALVHFLEACDGAVPLDGLDSLLHRGIGRVHLALADDLVVFCREYEVGLAGDSLFALVLLVVS